MIRSETQAGAARTAPRRWRTHPDRGPGEERHEAGRHRGGHERHDEQVDRRSDDREPPERARTMGSVAAWAASETPRLSASQRGIRPPPIRDESLRYGRRPGDQSRGRDRGQLEPGIGHEARIRQQQDDDGPPERGGRVPGTARLAREQDDAGHRARAQHRRRGAGERDVRGDRDDCDDRPTPTTEPAGDGRDRRRDDGDVPARDRHDVAHAGGRERGGDVAVDTVSKTDEDAGRQAGFGFRERHRQGVRGGAAQVFQALAGAPVGRVHRAQRVGVEAAPAPSRSRYCPYGESGRGRVRPSTSTVSPGSIAG